MQLTILKVILWPKNSDNPPRIVKFEPGKINVLTGESGTGKSTISSIVDYCLGSDKCSIPVGLIRDVTGWFGLHLKLANTEMILARRNPEGQQSTSDIFWREGMSVDVPAVVQKNARVEDVKNRFNQIAQLSSLEILGADNQTGLGRPSFRDMAAFNFQPQHIVANPYTYFYKADTTEHRDKLRIIFPLVLGAIDSDALALQRELKDLERDHERLRRELQARVDANKAWQSEIETYFFQARGLGFLHDVVARTDWTVADYVMALQSVPKRLEEMDLPDVKEGTGEQANRDLLVAIEQEDLLSQQVGGIRRRLSKIEQLSSAVGNYGSHLSGQRDRLQGVGWLSDKLKQSHTCPVCDAVHIDGNPQLLSLQGLAEEFSQISTSVQHAPAKLDQEIADLKQELRGKESALGKARHRRQSLEEKSEQSAAQRQRVRQIYLFVGRVEQALENVRASSDDGGISREVSLLAQRIAEIRRLLDPRGQRERLVALIRKVSTRIAYYAGLLKLEHASENVLLNARELTLQFTSSTGRTDFLWEVGSGQNWVGYHIAGFLALHEHFSSVKNNPVPRFLIVDQPSQVYFPEGWTSLESIPERKNSSTDIEGVRRIFNALDHFLEEMKGAFQIIVTEHAGSITWEGAKNVHMVENWREGQGDFLIPLAWYQ